MVLIFLYTPDFGGFLEAALKSAKQMKTKVSNSALLNFEEVYTLAQIEDSLRSRTLTALWFDPAELNCLDAGAFPGWWFYSPISRTIVTN